MVASVDSALLESGVTSLHNELQERDIRYDARLSCKMSSSVLPCKLHGKDRAFLEIIEVSVHDNPPQTFP